MNAIEQERMLYLARLLEQLDEKKKAGDTCPRFDMTTWMDASYHEFRLFKPKVAINKETVAAKGRGDRVKNYFTLAEGANVCGTACCAMGLAATDPHFQKLGLTIGFRQGESFPITEDIVTQGTVIYQGETEYKAASLLFGITERQAKLLFAPDAYPNTRDPLEVAARLRIAADLLFAPGL